MSSLIVTLAPTPPTANTPCSTVWTEDGSTAKRQLDTPLNLLPQNPESETVVVVPVARLSWHRVDFPKGTLERGFFQEGNAPRLRAVLDGLLEDRVLDEPAQLHFAIQPQPRADAPNWVAACDRAWLHAWLAALEQTGRPVSRIVPELAPPPDATPDAVTLVAMGTAEQPQLVCCSAKGTVVLPLGHSSAAMLGQTADTAPVLAEPAVAAMAEQYFSGRVSLQTAAQRAMAAAQSGWDLAQFDLLRTRGTRTRKQLAQLGNDLLHAPRWKPARWALLATVLVNLAGLQVWAWKEQAALAEKRTTVREILTMTFPEVRVVVDPPLQMARSLADLQRHHPALQLVGVGQDFSDALQLPSGLIDGPALMFYPGSSIGNFSPDAALRLLRQARAAAAGGALLIGVDRVKPVALLEAAYDDALGVTAAFNLNLLNHLNRLLDSNFNLRDWRHVALFNAAESRIEMHLQAHTATTVCWPGAERRFAAGERIHTESSYKWMPGDFAALLRDAGFSQVQQWADDQGWFGVCLASG